MDIKADEVEGNKTVVNRNDKKQIMFVERS